MRPGGTFEQVLEASRDYAVDLGSQLRVRVYNDVVPRLATAVASRRLSGHEPTPEELASLYRQTLFVLFRLLFVAYAEARDLLPYSTNERYRVRSLKTLARELACRKKPG